MAITMEGYSVYADLALEQSEVKADIFTENLINETIRMVPHG